MKIKALIAGLCASIAMANASLAQQPDKYKVRLVAGAPGYDHIQPFLAEYTKLWDEYGVQVDFMGRLPALQPDDGDRRFRRRL